MYARFSEKKEQEGKKELRKSSRKIDLIGRFFDGAKRYFVAALVFSLAATALNALTPQIFRFGVDSLLEDAERVGLGGNLWFLAVLLIGIAVAAGISQYIFRFCTAQAGENFAKNMRDVLFSHVQKLPMSWHDQNQTGDLIQRCTSDVEVIRNFVVTQLLEVFRTVFLIGISFAMMLSMNQKLSLIVLAFLPVVILYSAVFYRLIAERFVAADEAEGELSTVVQENATGVRVVRAFGREKFEMDRFHEKNERFAGLWIRLGRLSGLYWGIGDLITGLQVVAVIVFGTLEAVQGTISVGELIAFASYNTTLVWPVRGLGRILSDMSKAGVSFARVDYIIQAEEEDYQEEMGRSEENRKEAAGIVFDHVNFGYEAGKRVLTDLSFSIPPGTTFGILGGTGSGKSTIVQLLTRLYELEEGQGSIWFHGKEIREVPLKKLRKSVGMVLQEPFLYSKTIRENIAACAPDASMEEIRRVAGIACMEETIQHFPDGYDTIVGERGVTLSGGQRQRVAIARMLLAEPLVMVFDDSLSAVDSQTDSLIRKALEETRKSATVILISHRITTLMGADQILVLNQGRMAELGTHAELIQKQGIYRRIYEIQMSRDDRKKMKVYSMEGFETDVEIERLRSEREALAGTQKGITKEGGEEDGSI